ncbi:hypothetical protein HDU80_008264 [Chytriomyces hyalinus]|nr:hypothetical protein HDU80_008264 [Chytriomyces hyalinus]
MQQIYDINEPITVWDVVNTLRLAVDGTLPALESTPTELLSAPLCDQPVSQHEIKTEPPPCSSDDMPVAFEGWPQDEGPTSAVPPPLSSDDVPAVFDILPQDEGLSCSTVPASFSSDDVPVVFDVMPQDERPTCSAVPASFSSSFMSVVFDDSPQDEGPSCSAVPASFSSDDVPVVVDVMPQDERPTCSAVPASFSSSYMSVVFDDLPQDEGPSCSTVPPPLQSVTIKTESDAAVAVPKATETPKAQLLPRRGSETNVKQEQTSKQAFKPRSKPSSKLKLEPDNVHSDTAVPAPKITARPRVKKVRHPINSYHFFRSTTSNEALKLILQERFKTEPALKIKIDSYKKEHPTSDLKNALWSCMDASEKKLHHDGFKDADQKYKQNQMLAEDGHLKFEDSNDGASSSGSKRSRVTNVVKQEPAPKRTYIPTSKPTSKLSLETPLEPSSESSHLPVPPSVPSSSRSEIPPTVHQAPTSASRDNNNCNIFHMNASFQSVPSGSHPWQAQQIVPHPINALPNAYPWPVGSPHPVAQGHPFWMWNPADMWANPFASMITQATLQQQMLGLSFPQQSSGGSVNSSATRNPFSLGFGLDVNQQSDDAASVRNTWLQSIGHAAQGNADKVGSSPPHRAEQSSLDSIRNENQDACASSKAGKQETKDPAGVLGAVKGAGKSEGAMSELSLLQFLKTNAADKKSGLWGDGISQFLLKGKEFAWEDPENEGHVFTVPDYELTQEVEQAKSPDRYSMQFPVDQGQNVPVRKVETKPKPRPKRRVTTRQSKAEDGDNSSALSPATSTPKKGQGRNNNNNNDVDGNSEQERLRAENAFLLREIERLKK